MTEFERFAAARDLLFAHREDYEAARSAFVWPEFDQFNWALDWFDRIAQNNDATALWIVGDEGDAKRSFADLARRSAQVANHLRDTGVARGDRVLLMLPNTVPLWEITLACIKLGAVAIPTSTLLTPEDLSDRVARGAAKHVVVSVDQVTKFAAIDAGITRIVVGGTAPGWLDYGGANAASTDFTPFGESCADDPMLLYFTSGTSARPKLVLHSHRSYPVGHLSTMYWLGLKRGDVHLNISSPGWAKHAWSCFFAPWNAEATVLVINQARFSAIGMLEVMKRCAVTSVCAPATVWRMLIQENLAAYELPLREAASAGEPLNPEVIEQVNAAWGITIRDGYGQTETSALIGNSPGQPVRFGSMGRPLPGYEIILADKNGQPVEEGEICLSLTPFAPAGLMMGYQTEGEHRARVDGDFYRTGDIGHRDPDGWITYVGRADDVFKASDYRISPFELESALIEHDAVAEAAVVPSPDAVRLAVPKAFVALVGGEIPSRALALSIFQHIRVALAPYKRIRRIEFVDDLPKTISGKIRRAELRAGEDARPSNGKAGQHEWLEDEFPELREKIGSST